MMGNTLVPSEKRAVGRCDTVGEAICSHPEAADRYGAEAPGREGRIPTVTGVERARFLRAKQSGTAESSVSVSTGTVFYFEILYLERIQP